MLLEAIFLSLLLISLSVIGVIFFKKAPLLAKLPEADFPKLLIIDKIKKGIKKIPGSEKFDYELYLQKMLSKVQVLTLKTERKTGGWLEKLRRRRNGNGSHDDNYWEELKKAKEGK